ncbi:phospholipid-transporting ATPase [Nematocida sp. AWRm80]|nr:phospholipid-transporting ATPase [Nematocida sp. AWRm80]
MDVIPFPKVFRTKTNSVKSTTHSIFTFLPIRMFKEFTKSFNLFFLFLCCIVLIPNFTPFSSTSYILCVMMVISVNIIKAGVGEIKRYNMDRITNKEEYKAIRKGEIVKIHRENINLGEIIIVTNNTILPVDIVLIGAFKSEGLSYCYIETSSIDGESSLKIKKVLYSIGSTGDITDIDILQIDKLKEILYDREKTEGSILTEEDEIRYSAENIIPKGASVYGECSVVGISLGGMNEIVPRRIKNSLFMAMLSEKTILIIVIYIFILLICSISSSMFISESSWLRSINVQEWSLLASMKNFAANILVFSSLVPLSLFVTLDGLRVAYALYVKSDPGMAVNGQYCENNTHGVIEDIGLITHLLSDKTGTLTQNQMVFKGVYLKESPELYLFSDTSLKSIIERPYGVLTLLALVLCQSVEVVDRELTGVSQEEVCILKYLSDNGIRFVKREGSVVTVEIEDREVHLRIVSTMPFTPALSRMGVIALVGDIPFLMIKGSEETVQHGDLLEIDGKYRTLTVAAMALTKEEIEGRVLEEEIPSRIEEYSQMKLSEIHSSTEKIITVHNHLDTIQRLEKYTSYIATVCIEDVLQDKAEETIEKIKQKGVSIWIVTGDRRESAVSCASTTSILHSESSILSGKEAIQQLQQSLIQEQENTQLDHLPLTKQTGVVVYRSTPEDKKTIAHLLRKAGNVVMAVGDGDNDIRMIEEADVGISVVGKEGKKAAFASDIVVPTFFSLNRLITVHGSVCLERLKAVFLFYIFKSISVAICQCLYGITVGSSGSIASSSLFLLFCNALLTSPLSVEIGLFRKYSVVKTVEESILAGILYGVSCFVVVYQAFGEIDVIDQYGTLAGHSIVSRIFSLCLFVTILSHFIFTTDSFVSVSPITMGMSIGFFLISLGLDGGFDIFLYPILYLSLVYMVTVSIAIERFIAILRRKDSYPVHNLSSISEQRISFEETERATDHQNTLCSENRN